MQQPPKFNKKAPCAGALDGHDVQPFVRCNRDAPAGSSMIGVVLVTHGRLAVEFRQALEHVVGPQGQIEAVTIGPDDDVEERRKDIIEAVKRVDSGDGVAILTDMFGGTPNMSVRMATPSPLSDLTTTSRSAARTSSKRSSASTAATALPS